jgi:hypothetical protein
VSHQTVSLKEGLDGLLVVDDCEHTRPVHAPQAAIETHARTRGLRLASAAASWAAKDGNVNNRAGHRSFSSKAFLDTAPGFSRAGYISARIQIATDRTGPIF